MRISLSVFAFLFISFLAHGDLVGSETPEALLEQLQEPDRRTRQRAVVLLGEMPDQAQTIVPMIVRRWADITEPKYTSVMEFEPRRSNLKLGSKLGSYDKGALRYVYGQSATRWQSQEALEDVLWYLGPAAVEPMIKFCEEDTSLLAIGTTSRLYQLLDTLIEQGGVDKQPETKSRARDFLNERGFKKTETVVLAFDEFVQQHFGKRIDRARLLILGLKNGWYNDKRFQALLTAEPDPSESDFRYNIINLVEGETPEQTTDERD